MKKYLIIISLIVLAASCKSLINKDYSHLYDKESTYKVKETGQSPFVGTWDWVYDKPGVRNIRIFIGERNDSLMIGICAVLNYGNWVSTSSYDNNDKTIPDVCIANPKRGNTINTVYCQEDSRIKVAYFDSVTIKLMNKNTLVFLTAGGEYWELPRQMVLKRVNNENMEFSNEIDEVYKEVQK